MIEQHEFNTTWWGAPVGIVRDPLFFDAPAAERRSLLGPWEWVEYRSPAEGAASPASIAEAGFSWVDLQLHFRLALGRVEAPPSAERLEVLFADDEPFRLEAEELADFRHERFDRLPGATPARVNRRYALWGERLIAEHPGWCLRVRSDGQTQGWFLAEPLGGKLRLALATLHRDARLPGLLLYSAALRAYADRGARLGVASFSATNTAVLNLYARLGARFVAPEGCWLWARR